MSWWKNLVRCVWTIFLLFLSFYLSCCSFLHFCTCRLKQNFNYFEQLQQHFFLTIFWNSLYYRLSYFKIFRSVKIVATFVVFVDCIALFFRLCFRVCVSVSQFTFANDRIRLLLLWLWLLLFALISSSAMMWALKLRH